MQIRKMTIEDYEGVYRLWMSTPGMGLNNLDDSKDGIERYLHRNPNTCFVALDGNVIVGVIISGHDGRRGYIYHTAVALVVFDHNEIGNEFWEQRGFTKRSDLIYRNKTIKEMARIDT